MEKYKLFTIYKSIYNQTITTNLQIIKMLIHLLIKTTHAHNVKTEILRKQMHSFQARQTRSNSGGVAEGQPRFDKGGVAIIFYFLRVKNRTF